MNRENSRDETLFRTLRDWFLQRVHIFWSNWISTAGSVLIMSAIFLLVLMFFMFVYNSIVNRESNPYVDLVTFMVLPGFLAAGVLMVVAGNVVRRRREKTHGPQPRATEIGGAVLMRRAATVAAVGFVFLAGFGLFSYEAYHYTDSVQFCSYVCHTVMEPEATAYQSSPHAHVKCVECHIGPGASWFVRAKLSGLRQVYAVLTDDYSRPIPVPVENLRPAQETCEVCHWPSKFHGSKLVVTKHYESDEENTQTVTANVLHIGGPETPGGHSTGIHWHVDEGNQIRYRHLDRERQDIVEVIQTTPEGEVRYLKDGAEADSTAGEWRVMDCLDCHNRPTHIYDLPDEAVDRALASGRLDPSIPWLRKEAERVLREVVPDGDTQTRVASRLREIYADEHPDAADSLAAVLPHTAATLTEILERNVFPQMDVTWGTYTSNLGHFDTSGEMAAVGCFRCHDDEHESESGETIGQDCEKCHALLAWEESDWEGLPGVGATAFLRRR